MILDRNELRELTGRRQRTAQARVLEALGIRYARRPDGTLIVHEDEVRRALVGESPKRRREPDVEALLAYQNRSG